MPNRILQLNPTKTALEAFGRVIPCSCLVRNELNGARKLAEVVYSEPAPGYPYQPREFPFGQWQIGKPLARPAGEPYEYPYFIPTNAGQSLPIWQTVQKDQLEYDSPTTNTTYDVGYGLHYSTSPTTLGCVRISVMEDLLWLVSQINAALDVSDTVELEVL